MDHFGSALAAAHFRYPAWAEADDRRSHRDLRGRLSWGWRSSFVGYWAGAQGVEGEGRSLVGGSDLEVGIAGEVVVAVGDSMRASGAEAGR